MVRKNRHQHQVVLGALQDALADDVGGHRSDEKNDERSREDAESPDVAPEPQCETPDAPRGR
jgi:hypothetical protein